MLTSGLWVTLDTDSQALVRQNQPGNLHTDFRAQSALHIIGVGIGDLI